MGQHSRSKGRALRRASLFACVIGIGALVGSRLESPAHAEPQNRAPEGENVRWFREVRKLDEEATAHMKAGRYWMALGSARTAVRLCEITPGMPASQTILSLIRLASILEATGQRTEAIANFRRAMKTQISDPHHDPAALAGTRRHLSTLLYGQGLVEEASKVARDSFVSEGNSIDPRQRANELGSLGAWLLENGDREGSESAYREALSLILKRNTPDELIANLSQSLGVSLMGARRYSDAEASFQGELATRKQLRPQDSTKIAIALGNVASAELSLGKCDEAKRNLEEASTLLAPTHPSLTSARELLALSFVCVGNLDRADRELGALAAQFSNPAVRRGPVYARFIDSVVTVTRAEGNIEKTLGWIRAGNQARRELTTSVLKTESDGKRRAYLEWLRKSVDTALSFNLTDARTSPAAAGAAYEALIDFKGRLLEAGIEEVLRQQRAGSSTLETLSTIQGRLDEIAQIMHRSDPRVALRDVPAVSLQSIQARLGPTDALVEIALYRPVDQHRPSIPSPVPHYAAYVLRRAGMPRAVELGPAKNVDEQVSKALRLLVSKDPAYKTVAQDLYSKMFQPIAELLGDSVNLYIAPDGELTLFPFAALVDGSQYLTKRYQITYLTSGRDLLRVTHRINPRARPQIYAAPDYDAVVQKPGSAMTGDTDSLATVLGLSFGDLIGTQREATVLASILTMDPDGIHTGAIATETALKATHGPSILHIATHGFYVDGETDSSPGTRKASQKIQAPSGATHTTLPWMALPPLQRSGLALAGANRRAAAADDGILTAQEILEMDLNGTQLVTLSACDTARGKTSVGEGVWGLRRALAAAGAETQMITLWKLDDKQTVAMIEEYYTRLRKGEGRSAALRNTQLSMIEMHPYYWASFIVAGDPSPMHDQVILPFNGR